MAASATFPGVVWITHDLPEGYAFRYAMRDAAYVSQWLREDARARRIDEAAWSRRQRLAVALYPATREIAPIIGWIMCAGAFGCFCGGIRILISRGELTGMTHALVGLGVYGLMAVIPAVTFPGVRGALIAYVPTLLAWAAALMLNLTHAVQQKPIR